MEKTFDLDLTVGANWTVTSGSHYLRIAQYQGKVSQLGSRWEWFATYLGTAGALINMVPPFDHGTADHLHQAKAAAEQVIQDHNAKLRTIS